MKSKIMHLIRKHATCFVAIGIILFVFLAYYLISIWISTSTPLTDNSKRFVVMIVVLIPTAGASYVGGLITHLLNAISYLDTHPEVKKFSESWKLTTLKKS